jgi:hypothetical protein
MSPSFILYLAIIASFSVIGLFLPVVANRSV